MYARTCGAKNPPAPAPTGLVNGTGNDNAHIAFDSDCFSHDTASTRRPVIVASGVNTDGDNGGAALAADTFVALTLSATESNLVLAADDELLLVATEGGSATLPAGRLVVELLYL